jgi:uncharacterized protein (TIGR02594 family)
VRKEPRWLRLARADLGLAEIPGKDTAPTITRWLRELRAWWSDDETPWCGVAVAAWMRGAGLELPQHWYRAKAWLEWGYGIPGPCHGCVVVFGRQGGGHVGIVVGVAQDGRLMVLGGNQGNKVSIAPFDRFRVLGYRWPTGEPRHFFDTTLQTLASAEASSRNEA